MSKYRIILRESYQTMAFDFYSVEAAAHFAQTAIQTHKKKKNSEKISVELQIADAHSDPKAYLDMNDKERGCVDG